jgi:DNA-binding winged helix-turn-helix (wHTH) protein/tetratricopeptide (TPR) repeat protein
MPANLQSAADFRVGDWIVRPQLAEIRRGPEMVHLTPRAMAVLVYLAGAKGAVVSRNELLDAIWPRMSVTQDALGQCLVELRKAFGDSSRNPTVIGTVPKVGIRLIAPVAPWDAQASLPVVDSPPAESRVPKRWTRTAGVAALIVVVSAATIMFTTRSNRAQPVAASAPARDLFLSADDYTRRPNRVEALTHEEELLRRTVAEDPNLAVGWARLGRAHTGMYWYGVDRTPARLALAEQALRRALALDPALPEAHVYLANYYYKGLGDASAALKEFGIAERSIPHDAELHFLRAAVYRRTGKWDLAVADGEAAIQQDGRNVNYLRQQSVTHMFLRDYARAEQTLDRILVYYPDDATTYVDKVALALARNGDTELAHRYASASPTPTYAQGLAYTYTQWLTAIFDRDYAAALGILDGAPEDRIFDGDLRTTRAPKTLFYARTHALAGDEQRARLEFRSVAKQAEEQLAGRIERDPLTTAALYLTLAECQAEMGQREVARQSAARARTLVPDSTDALAGSAIRLAYILRVLAPLGDRDATLAELEKYLGAPGHWAIEGLAADPRLQPLRDDSRFAALVARYRRM